VSLLDAVAKLSLELLFALQRSSELLLGRSAKRLSDDLFDPPL
jgi:hypothetical protein